MMKKQAVLIGLIFSVQAYAEDFHQVLDASADAEIRIHNTAGDIEVQGWSRNQVEVEAELGRGVTELVFESDGDEVEIYVKVPRNHSRNISADLVINVPVGASLEISGVSTDISVEDVEGRLELGSVSGDISSTAFASDIIVESVSGDIEVQGNDSKIRSTVETVSGDIELQNLAGEIRSDSVSGDVILSQGAFESANLQTVNGDILYEANLYGEGRLYIETVNGDVEVEFIGDLSARIDIETFNGSIDNCFGVDSHRTSKYAPGRELRFTEGDGEGRVEIQTLNGSVSICKED